MGAIEVGMCVICALCETAAAAAADAYWRCSLEGVLRVLRIEATALDGSCIRGGIVGSGGSDDSHQLEFADRPIRLTCTTRQLVLDFAVITPGWLIERTTLKCSKAV